MTSHNPLVALHERFKQIRPELETAFEGNAAALDRVRETTEKLRADADGGTLHALVFGHYNAGKSTFINALLGHEVAPMGDVPLTASIVPYEWEGHILFDSPGIDAPIEHEAVTDEFIRRDCNAVIYVIPTGGAIEEASTWERLCGFVRERKAVLVVVNDRSGETLNGPVFADLRNTLYANIKAAAARAGIADPLDLVDVLHVKARTALKARLEGKAALLQGSGILQAEGVLRRFFSTSNEKILAADRERARVIVNEALAAMAERAGDDAGKQLAESRNDVEREQVRLQTSLMEELDRLIQRETERMHGAVGAIANQGGDMAALLATRLGESQDALAEGVRRQLDEELVRSEAVVRRVSDRLRDQLALAKVGLDKVKLKTPTPDPSDKAKPEGEDDDASNKFFDMLKKLPLKDWTEDGAKSLLAYGKKKFPDLFKGIGKKTMGKWAGVAGKAVGPILIVAQSGYELVQVHRDDARAREAFEGLVESVMDNVRLAFDEARRDYQLMFRDVAHMTLRPLQDAIDTQAQVLARADGAMSERQARLAAWTRELEV